MKEQAILAISYSYRKYENNDLSVSSLKQLNPVLQSQNKHGLDINDKLPSLSAPTIVDKNIGTNDKFRRKVVLLRYTESVKFRSQS